MSLMRKAFGTAMVLIAFVIVVLGTFLLRAEVSWRKADSLRAEGRLPLAVRAARGVFDFYVPGNPRLDHASTLIWQAAETHEAEGDPAAALEEYRTLRSAWIGAHPPMGDPGWIAKSEARIAQLLSSTGDGSPGEGESARLAQMRSPSRPFGIWGGVAALGFAGWLLATAGLITRSFRSDGSLTADGIGWVGVVAVTYMIWILGMMRA